MASVKMTETEFDLFCKQATLILEQTETEENWNSIEDTITKLGLIVKGSELENLVPIIKNRLKNGLLATDRTRLARSALTFVSTLAVTLESKFEQLTDVVLPAVLKLTTRANKVYVLLATDTLKLCIKHCGVASFIPNLIDALKSTSKTQRIAVAQCLDVIMMRNEAERIAPWVVLIEFSISEGITDSSNEVREFSRSIFQKYASKFPDRLDKFINSLSDIAKRYLKLEHKKSRLSLGKKQSPKKQIQRFTSQTFRADNEDVNDISNREIVKNLDLAVSDKAMEFHTARQTKRIIGPARVQHEILQETPKNLSQARRIPRNVQRAAQETLTKPRLQPAQRIPSTEHQNIVIDRPPSSENIFDAKPEVPKKEVTVAVNKPKKIDLTGYNRPKKTKSVAALNNFESDMQSHDWSVRNRVFISLEQHLSDKLDLDYTNYQTIKIAKIMSKGLGDAHFKVIIADLVAINAFIRENISLSCLSMLLPAILGISHFPHHKTKQTLIDRCEIILESIMSKVPPQIVGQAICNGFADAKFNSKTRIGCLGFLSCLTAEQIELMMAKHSTCKLLVHRLAPFTTDHDMVISKMVTTVFQHIFDVYPDVVYSGSVNFSATEREMISDILRVDISKIASPVKTVSEVTSPQLQPDSIEIEETPTKPRLSKVEHVPDTLEVSIESNGDVFSDADEISVEEMDQSILTDDCYTSEFESETNDSAKVLDEIDNFDDEFHNVDTTATTPTEKDHSTSSNGNSSLSTPIATEKTSINLNMAQQMNLDTPRANATPQNVTSKNAGPTSLIPLPRSIAGSAKASPIIIDQIAKTFVTEKITIAKSNDPDGVLKLHKLTSSFNELNELNLQDSKNNAEVGNSVDISEEEVEAKIHSIIDDICGTNEVTITSEMVENVGIVDNEDAGNAVTASISDIVLAEARMAVNENFDNAVTVTLSDAVLEETKVAANVPLDRSEDQETSKTSRLGNWIDKKLKRYNRTSSTDDLILMEKQADSRRYSVGAEVEYIDLLLKVPIKAKLEKIAPSSENYLPTPYKKAESELTIAEVNENESVRLEKDSVVDREKLLFELDTDYETLTARLTQIRNEIQDPSISMDVDQVTKYLNLIFESARVSVKTGSVSLGYMMSQCLLQLEQSCQQSVLLDAILNSLNNDLVSQLYYEILLRLVSKTALESQIDARLSEIIAKGINSTISGTRKSAFELGCYLLDRKNPEWENEFYNQVKLVGGSIRVNLVKSMVAQRHSK